MKRSQRCPKCGSRRIGHLSTLPDTTRSETEVIARFLGLAKQGDRRVAAGKIEAYVCAGCGYLEMYVKDPEQVPFEDLEGFSWVKPSATPYR